MYPQIVFTLAVLAVLLPLCVVVELISPRERFTLASRLPGAIYYVLFSTLILLIAWPMRAAWAAIGVHPLLDISGLPLPFGVLALVLFLDWLRYVEHRIQHRYWWPVHAVHHSATEMHGLNSYSHPLMKVTEFLFIAVPMSLINFGHVSLPFWVGLATAFQALVIHSPLRIGFGPLQRILVDPAFHRIHHSMEQRHFGKNYGVIFTIWDQLLGTAYFPADDEWPATGLEGRPPPRNVADFLMMPLRNMVAWRESSKHPLPSFVVQSSAFDKGSSSRLTIEGTPVVRKFGPPHR